MTHLIHSGKIFAALAVACALSACAPMGASAGDTGAPTAEAVKALAAYPARPEGWSSNDMPYQRHVIDLPPLPDGLEDARKVELIAGRMMTVDCNRQGLGGSFAEQSVSGWGYSYWVFERSRGTLFRPGDNRGFSTRMACLTGETHQAFVRAQSTLVRYNSRLPVVAYLPEGFELRWRVWRAGDEQTAQVR